MEFTPARTIRLWNDEISAYETEKSVEAIEKLLIEDREKLISLEIYSGGGNCMAGFALCDWLELNNVPIQTIGYGQVSSMAIPIFLMGRKRILSVHCTMTLHPMASVFEKQTFDSNELRNQVVQLGDWQTRYLNHIAKRVPSLKLKEIKKLVEGAITLDAKKAKKLGFADEVIGV